MPLDPANIKPSVMPANESAVRLGFLVLLAEAALVVTGIIMVVKANGSRGGSTALLHVDPPDGHLGFAVSRGAIGPKPGRNVLNGISMREVPGPGNRKAILLL